MNLMLKVCLIFSSTDETGPALPPKLDRRPVKSSATIISNRSRSSGTDNSLLISSFLPNKTKQDKDNDERIQLIVDDINQIVEKYTRELDDALHSKTNVRSPSIDHLVERKHSTIVSTPFRHNSIDTLYESNVSKLMKSTITKTTVNNGQGVIDRKESAQIYNGTDCSVHSPKGGFQTQNSTLVHRQQSNDEKEPTKVTVTSRVSHINISDNNNGHIPNDPPPLPPKRKTGSYLLNLLICQL